MPSCFSGVWLFSTPWTVPYQAPLSIGLSRQKYWSGLPFPSPGIFPTQELNPRLMSPALAVGLFTTSSIFYYIKQCKKSQAQATLNRSISPCIEREGQGTECLRASSSIFFLLPRELKQHSRNHCPGKCLPINFCFSKNFVELRRVGFISRNACIYCYCI